jgi:hypothetical protein
VEQVEQVVQVEVEMVEDQVVQLVVRLILVEEVAEQQTSQE